MSKYLVLSGPNLNMLGKREPGVYGTMTLDEIHNKLHTLASELGVVCNCHQSNHEGELVESIQNALGNYDGIVLNAAAYTHTSIALRDAIAATKLPVVEVHLSNVHSREDFRHYSYLAPICMGVICGLGWRSYAMALRYLVEVMTDG